MSAHASHRGSCSTLEPGGRAASFRSEKGRRNLGRWTGAVRLGFEQRAAVAGEALGGGPTGRCRRRPEAGRA